MKKLAALLPIFLAACATVPEVAPAVDCDVISTMQIPADMLQACELIPPLTGKKFGDVVVDDIAVRDMYAQCKKLNADKADFIQRSFEAQREACRKGPKKPE